MKTSEQATARQENCPSAEAQRLHLNVLHEIHTQLLAMRWIQKARGKDAEQAVETLAALDQQLSQLSQYVRDAMVDANDGMTVILEYPHAEVPEPCTDP